MTSSVSWTKWRIYLALVLVCQTTRRAEGHPRAFKNEVSREIGNSTDISKLIETAYERQELLRPEQWHSRQTGDYLVTRSVDRDNSRQLDYPNDEISVSGETGVFEETSTDSPMRRSNVDEKIVFPTDGGVSTIQTSMPASACHKSLFCENVADYPRQLVNAAIARNASLKFLESVDPMPDVEQRIDTTDEVPLCRYREQVVYPQTAQNKEKQWLFIVNQDNLKQGIRIEVCLNEGQECNMIQGFAEGYKTSCKQKFIYRELAAVGSNGNIVKDQFRFPSSCCCHVKFTGDSTVRLGIDLRSLNQTTATVSKTRRRQ